MIESEGNKICRTRVRRKQQRPLTTPRNTQGVVIHALQIESNEGWDKMHTIKRRSQIVKMSKVKK